MQAVQYDRNVRNCVVRKRMRDMLASRLKTRMPDKTTRNDTINACTRLLSAKYLRPWSGKRINRVRKYHQRHDSTSEGMFLLSTQGPNSTAQGKPARQFPLRPTRAAKSTPCGAPQHLIQRRGRNLAHDMFRCCFLEFGRAQHNRKQRAASPESIA